MNCEEAQKSLVYYLDGELDPQDQLAGREHLSTCSRCQKELAALEAVRQSASQALQSQAERSEPSPQAWSLLQARLMREARPAWPSRFSQWISRPFKGRIPGQAQSHTGDNTMRKILIPAFAAVLVLVLFAVYATRSATPVSAQQILDRASAAQASSPTSGIQHIRVEAYTNINALPGDQAGTTTYQESYIDLANGNTRMVVTDASGKVSEVYAYDGANSYSSNPGSSPLEIYKAPQRNEKMQDVVAQQTVADPKRDFDKFRHATGIEIQGKETWNGRQVYILRTQGPVKVMSGDTVDTPTGYTRAIFDAETYQMFEFRMTLNKDGQEIVVNSQKYLTNEILPASTHVAWDLSDLQNVTFVDDPRGEHGDKLPEAISPADLNAQAENLYVLGKVPEGFTQQITTAPGQPKDQPFAYVISYRNTNGEYITIQPIDQGKAAIFMVEDAKTTYTTSSGLVLYIQEKKQADDGKNDTAAVVKAPDGTTFLLNSTFGVEELKGIAEGLVKSKG